MRYLNFIWSAEIIEHLATHAVSADDFEGVVCNPVSKGVSRSSGLPVAWGYASDGRYIMTVYEEIDSITILPVTAYQVPEPR